MCTLLQSTALRFNISIGGWEGRLLAVAARGQELPDHALHLGPEGVVDFRVDHLGHNPVNSLFQHTRPEKENSK